MLITDAPKKQHSVDHLLLILTPIMMGITSIGIVIALKK